MSRNMNWKSWAILGLAVAVLVTSGSLVMASNMGFKINKVVTANYTGTLGGQNWISLPYNNPYTKAINLCQAFGIATSAGTVSQINPSTGALSNCPCNTNPILPTNFTITTTRAVRWTNTGASPTNVVLVGSSNEASNLTVLAGFTAPAAPKGHNWISVPYHTTWIKAADICNSMGYTTATPGANGVTISRISGSSLASYTCNQSVVLPQNFSLVIGEGIRVTNTGASPANDKIFLPPHF